MDEKKEPQKEPQNTPKETFKLPPNFLRKRNNYITVETHPQGDEIIAALMNGQPSTVISRWARPKITVEQLRTFKHFRMAKVIKDSAALPMSMAQALQSKGLCPDNEEVAQVVADVSAAQAARDPLLARIQRNYKVIDEQLDVEQGKDKDKRSAGALCALIQTDMRVVEMEAKLTGRLESQGQGIQINILTPHSPKGDMQSPIVEIGERK